MLRHDRPDSPHSCKAESWGAWCWHCYTNVKGKTNVPGHRAYRPVRVPTLLYQSQLMKRHSPEVKNPTGKWKCPDKEFVADFPLLAEHLCDSLWEDGKPREVGSLTIRLGGGSVFVSLTDYDLEASIFCNEESIWGAFREINEVLASPSPPWRRWKSGKGRK